MYSKFHVTSHVTGIKGTLKMLKIEEFLKDSLR